MHHQVKLVMTLMLLEFIDWHHTHTESGKDVSHKWMAVIWFDEAGKIHQFNDFFDVAGFLVQHEE